MASIADIEQLLEQIFERSAARLFRTRIQTVQIERRVERAMERSRSGRGARTEVPAHYRVRLHPDDLGDVAPTPADAQALAARLADAALSFARAHAYHLPGRPSVALMSDPSLERGRVDVDAGAVGGHAADRAVPPANRRGSAAGNGAPRVIPTGVPGVVPASAPRGADSQRLDGDRPPAAVDGDRADAPAAASGPVVGGEVRLSPGGDAPVDPGGEEPPAMGDPWQPERGTGGIRGDGTQTLVFRRPAPETARAVLRVLARDGRETAVEVDGRPLTVGRARDNTLVLDDPRVSRHHGRLQTRHGTLVYTDVGSTNGSRVNGIRVDEIALGVGDRLLLGDTVLVVESLPD